MPKNNPALFQAIFEADKLMNDTNKPPVEGEKAKKGGRSKPEGALGEPSPFDFDKLLNAVKESISKDTKPPRKPREKPSEEAYKRTLEILAKGRETRKANMEAKKKGDAKPSVEKPAEVEKPVEAPKPVEGGGSPKAPSAEKEQPKITNNHQGDMGEVLVPQPKQVEPPKPEPPKISVSQPQPKTPVIFGKNFRANISRR